MSWKVSAVCHGVKKGCRKNDRHSSPVLATYAEKPSERTAIALASAWSYMNMKKIQNADAVMTYWSTEGDIETWQPFNQDHNIKIKII